VCNACVSLCTVLLPLGVNAIAFNKYITTPHPADKNSEKKIKNKNSSVSLINCVNAFSTDRYTENFSTLLDRYFAFLWRVEQIFRLKFYCDFVRSFEVNSAICLLNHVYAMFTYLHALLQFHWNLT